MTDAPGSLLDQAWAARRAGDPQGALVLYRKAAAACTDPADVAHSLRHIGDLAREAGDNEVARDALERAEQLYRETVSDGLALANTLRLRALLDDSAERWREARQLYAAAAADGWDMAAALAECDRHLG